MTFSFYKEKIKTLLHTILKILGILDIFLIENI